MKPPLRNLTSYSRTHFVRVGALGAIGRFTSVDAVEYVRGTRVICRTSRGLELGHVLRSVPESEVSGGDGSILRRVLPEDDLVLVRLEKNRAAAYDACVTCLAEQNQDAVLVDVEHLFDGQSLFFYFLGHVSGEVEQLTQALADVYVAKAQVGAFAAAVEAGCGPDCGTESAAGCGDTCISCAVANVCHKA